MRERDLIAKTCVPLLLQYIFLGVSPAGHSVHSWVILMVTDSYFYLIFQVYNITKTPLSVVHIHKVNKCGVLDTVWANCQWLQSQGKMTVSLIRSQLPILSARDGGFLFSSSIHSVIFTGMMFCIISAGNHNYSDFEYNSMTPSHNSLLRVLIFFPHLLQYCSLSLVDKVMQMSRLEFSIPSHLFFTFATYDTSVLLHSTASCMLHYQARHAHWGSGTIVAVGLARWFLI